MAAWRPGMPITVQVVNVFGNQQAAEKLIGRMFCFVFPSLMMSNRSTVFG